MIFPIMRFTTSLLFSILSSVALGQFTERIDISDYYTESVVETADMNNDGASDIIVLSKGSNTLRIYLNDGLGNFTLVQELLCDYSSRARLVIGDADNDGWLDILTTRNTNNALILYRNNNGTLINYETIHNNNNNSGINYCFTKSNGDNYPEIVVDEGIGYLYLIDNNLGVFQLGDTLTTTLTLENMNYEMIIESIDMDNDGDEDIVTNHEDNSLMQPPNGFPLYNFWYENLGSGNYLRHEYGIRESNVNVNYSSMYDLNGDNLPDFVNLTGALSSVVWWDNLNPSFSFLPGSGVLPTTMWPHIYGFTYEKEGNFVKGDLNNDGLMDFLLHDESKIYALINDNTNNFTRIVIFDDLPSTITGAEHFHYDIADFNGDGFNDLVVSSLYFDDLFWLENDGNLGFDQHIIGYNSSQALFVHPFDYNNDGNTDLLCKYKRKSGLHKFDGTGPEQFDPNTPVYDGSFDGQGSHEIDMDGDGDLDLLITEEISQGTGLLKWFENTPTDPFSIGHDFDLGATYYQLVIADIDNNGFDDIVKTFTDISVFYNDGGTFSPETIITSGLVSEIQVADMNGDQLKDIVLATVSGFGEIKYLENLGNQTFAPISPAIGQGKELTLADLNGDGLIDILSTISYFGKWMENTGNWTFGPAQNFYYEYQLPLQENIVVDFDLDGDMDVLSWGHWPSYLSDQDEIRWCENDGNQNFVDHTIAAGIDKMYDMELYDLDQDGDMDVIVSIDPDTIGYFRNETLAPLKINGNVFVDINGDGVQNGQDPGFNYVQIQLQPDALAGYTNVEGNYFFSVDTGSYVVSYVNLDTNLWQLTTDSMTYNITLDSLSTNSLNNNFGFNPLIDSTSLVNDIASGALRCDQVVIQSLTVQNVGGSIPAGVIAYEHDTSVVILNIQPVPDSVVNNFIYWHFDSLFFYEDFGAYVEFLTPDFNAINDILHFNLSTETIDSLGQPEYVFSDSFNGLLTCAYDPNNKIPEILGYTDQGFIHSSEEYIDYTINFQNTGTDTALNVTVLDHLDVAFDWSTFQIISASHNMHTSLTEYGEITFDFPDINLPDSNASVQNSKGYVKYRVHLDSNLIPGTIIQNFASILFDANPAIVTNATTHTIFDCNWLKGIIIDSSNLCLSDLSSIVSSGQYIENFNWTINGNSESDSSALNYQFASTGAFNVHLMVDNPICAYDTAFTINIGERPIIDIYPTYSEIICSGDTLSLNTSNFNSSWSQDGIFISSDSLLLVFEEALYSVQAGTGLCIDYDTLNVDFQTIPQVNISSNTAEFYVCDGNPINLISDSLNGNTWLYNDSVVGSNLILPVTSAGWYSLVMDAGTCDAAIDSVHVFEFSQQQVSISNTGLFFCQGDSTVLSSPSLNNIWTSNQLIVGNTDSISVYDEGWYVLEYSDSVCPTGFDSLYITVEQLPVAAINVLETEICAGDSVMLWNLTSGSEWYFQSNLVSTADSIYSHNGGWYYLEVPGAYCPSQMDSVYIEETLPLTASIQYATDSICPGELVVLSTTNSNVQWYSGSIPFLGSNSSLVVGIDNWYYLDVLNAPCPIETDSVKITVLAVPAGPVIVQDGNMLIISDPLVSTVQWFYNGDILSGEVGDTLIVQQDGVYRANLTLINGCILSSENYSYSTIGIKEGDLSNSKITIYPVPVEDELVITTSEKVLDYSFCIIQNVLGEIEYFAPITIGTKYLKIDVSKMASGVYYIRMYNSNNEFTHLKFIHL